MRALVSAALVWALLAGLAACGQRVLFPVATPVRTSVSEGTPERLGDHAFGAVSVHVPAKLFGSAARLQSLDEPPHRVPRDLRVDEAGDLSSLGFSPAGIG